jgi:hypothetical protein
MSPFSSGSMPSALKRISPVSFTVSAAKRRARISPVVVDIDRPSSRALWMVWPTSDAIAEASL